nr:hypothetical protein [uncultured bacterium]
MAHSLQHSQAAQFIGLSSACTGKHRSDGPKADNALTFKLDHPMGGRHSGLTLNVSRSIDCARIRGGLV